MLNYKIMGSGKTIVFLHGWGASSKVFDYFTNALSKSYRTLTIDMVAHNGQDEPQYSIDVYQYAIEVFLTLKSLNIDDFVLVGHSFGGRMAIILSSLFNINIKTIVLVDSAGIKEKANILSKIKVRYFKMLKSMSKVHLISKKWLESFGSSDYKLLSNVMKNSFVKIVNEDLTYLLSKINQSTLIFWGKNDKSTPLYMAKKIKKCIHNSGLVVVSGGHYAFLEHKNQFLNILFSLMESV